MEIRHEIAKYGNRNIEVEMEIGRPYSANVLHFSNSTDFELLTTGGYTALKIGSIFFYLFFCAFCRWFSLGLD